MSQTKVTLLHFILKYLFNSNCSRLHSSFEANSIVLVTLTLTPLDHVIIVHEESMGDQSSYSHFGILNNFRTVCFSCTASFLLSLSRGQSLSHVVKVFSISYWAFACISMSTGHLLSSNESLIFLVPFPPALA